MVERNDHVYYLSIINCNDKEFNYCDTSSERCNEGSDSVLAM